MVISGNVILPVFFLPYLFMLFPLTASIVVAMEATTYKLLNRENRLWRLFLFVLALNLASTLLGGLIALFLPTGFGSKLTGQGAQQAETVGHGPQWETDIICAWALAFILSIAVEYALIRVSMHPDSKIVRITRPFVTSGLANVMSYGSLIAVLWIMNNIKH